MAKAATRAEPIMESILDDTFDNVERPKPLPRGNWITIVTGHQFGKSSQQQTDFVEYTFKILEPGTDVDGKELEAYLTRPDGTKKTLTDMTVRHKYYITPNAEFMLKDFLASCGVPLKGRSKREVIPEAVNCEVGIFIAHEPWQNNEGVSAKIMRTFKV